MTLNELCSKTLNHIDVIMHQRALGIVSPEEAVRVISYLLDEHTLQERLVSRS